MRRFWTVLLAAGLILGAAAAGAYAQNAYRKEILVEYKGIKLAVDGREVATPDEPFLYVDAGRTFVPARPLAEALDAKVGWDAETNTVQVYTKAYATMALTDSGFLWTHPWGGFTLKTPPTYFRLDMPFALIQLVKPLSTGNVMVAVQRWPASNATPEQKVDEVINSLGSVSLLTDAQVSETAPEEGRVTARGTGNFMGTGQVAYTLRIQSTPEADWILLGLVPTASAETAGPEVEAILASFSLK